MFIFTSKIKIYFNDLDNLNNNKEIKITYYKSLGNKDISYFLMKNKIITPAIIYELGVCLKNT